MPVARLVRSALCGAAVLGSLLVSAQLAMSAVYSPRASASGPDHSAVFGKPSGPAVTIS